MPAAPWPSASTSNNSLRLAQLTSRTRDAAAAALKAGAVTRALALMLTDGWGDNAELKAAEVMLDQPQTPAINVAAAGFDQATTQLAALITAADAAAKSPNVPPAALKLATTNLAAGRANVKAATTALTQATQQRPESKALLKTLVDAARAQKLDQQSLVLLITLTREF